MCVCARACLCVSLCLTFVSLQLVAHHWFLPSIEADDPKDEICFSVFFDAFPYVFIAVAIWRTAHQDKLNGLLWSTVHFLVYAPVQFTRFA